MYRMDGDIARGLRHYRKMKGLLHPIVWSISGCGAKKHLPVTVFQEDRDVHYKTMFSVEDHGRILANLYK